MAMILTAPLAFSTLSGALNSIVNVLHGIAQAILQYLLNFTEWFRDVVLSDPWRASHFIGSTIILMLP